MRDIVLYATDTMADWEYAYLTAGFASAAEREPGRFRLRVLGDGGQTEPTVRTKGGLRVHVDGDIGETEPERTALLVLPGADTWAEGHDSVLDLAGRLVEGKVTVAAICGGTLGAARAGLLDHRKHTSNAPEFLAGSGYAGAAHYRIERVVADDGVVTAPGTMPVDFAAAIFFELEVFPDEVVEAWYGLFTTGEKRYYERLATSVGP